MEDDAPFAHRGHDSGKIVIGEYHLCRMTLDLQCVHDLQLVLWRDARVDGDLANGQCDRRVIETIEFRTAQHPCATLDDAEVCRNARRSARMIAGDHDHADAGTMCLPDRHCRLLARRVDDADGADEDQMALEILACGILVSLQGTVGHGKRAQCIVGECVDIRENALAQVLVERYDIHADTHVRAAAEQHVWRALGNHHEPIILFVVDLDGRHHLAFGGERNLADALEALFAPLGQSEFAFRHEECSLGGIALHLPYAVFPPMQSGIACKAAAAQHDNVLGLLRGGSSVVDVALHLAVGRVTDSSLCVSHRKPS